MSRQPRPLPDRANLDQLRKQAKELRQRVEAGDVAAAARVRKHLDESRRQPLKLADAQFVIAREYGSPTWADLKRRVEDQGAGFRERVAVFIETALPPIGGSHASGNLERARALLAADPAIARADIYTASLLGEVETVRAMLERERELASRKGGTRGWDPLLHLCFSRFLRLDAARGPRMVQVAKLLLQHGADPNTHWIDTHDAPGARESAVYGAAGVACHVELTRLLLEAGADPNDGETPYHAAEHEGVPCAELLFAHGLDAVGQSTLLLHKLDYDDDEGVRRLLELGAPPNETRPFGKTALHQAVFRGKSRRLVELLLAHGADPGIKNAAGKTPYALAARAGQAETMEVLVAHGASVEMDPSDRFLAACAAGDAATVQSLLAERPGILGELSAEDRAAIVEAAAAGNTEGVRTMLDAGFDVDTRGMTWEEGPIHRAAMDGRFETVRLLLDRGADLTLRDKQYHSSPLGWAAHGGQREVLDLLLQDDSKIDLRDAIEFGRAVRAGVLLGDTDPDAPIGGAEPGVLLRAAAHGGHVELIRLLLERGADPARRNSEGETALDYARQQGRDAAVTLLEQAVSRGG